MKLKNLHIRNHQLFNDLTLDFTNPSGEIINTIIIAGENGTGKSTLLNLIYDFFMLGNVRDDYGHFMQCTIELSDEEFKSLTDNQRIDARFKLIKNSTLTIERDYTIKGSWTQIKFIFIGANEQTETISGNMFPDTNDQMLRAIFSDVEINFTPQNISSVTAKDVDQKNLISQRSSQALATEITQLLIDIQALDDADFAEWGRKNVGKLVNESALDNRIGRFKNAFAFLFPNKQYKRVINHQNGKKVIFDYNGKDIFLESLSSGEKQIVFRGGFLLQNQKTNPGSLVLIDEPEISLHPGWQLKILEFYKRLFTSSEEQLCQLFIATHSPFIIHNDNRINDKVIVLKIDNNGNVVNDGDPMFYGWSNQKTIEHAFRLSELLQSNESDSPVLITEGKTDAIILTVAWDKLYPSISMPFKVVSSGIEVVEAERTGNADQVRRTLELLPNVVDSRLIIGLFDNDREGNEQFKGLNKKTFEQYDVSKSSRKHLTKNIYGILLPVPAPRKIFVTLQRPEHRYLTIEHYFRDEVLEKHNLIGEKILNSPVFEINGNKTSFANITQSLDASEFEAFRLLFESVKSLIS